MRETANPSGKNDVGNTTKLPVTGGLHPHVYTIAIGLAIWLVLSVWLFAGNGIADYLLAVVSGFIAIAVGLPFILSRVGRNDPGANRHAAIGAETPANEGQAPMSFRDWAAADFATGQGRLSGRAAAVQVLLPIAAVAIGMAIFGIALHVAERAGPMPLTASYSSGSVVKNSG